jgi:hypothetical protein
MIGQASNHLTGKDHLVQSDACIAGKIDQRGREEREGQDEKKRNSLLVCEVEICAHERHDYKRGSGDCADRGKQYCLVQQRCAAPEERNVSLQVRLGRFITNRAQNM